MKTDRTRQLSEKQLDAAANAMYQAQVDTLIARISQTTYDFDRALSFFRSCRTESDRALPVLLFSFIDNAMRELFSAELFGTSKEIKQLFGPFGPLGTTSARIRILVALGWVSGTTSKSLDLIRKIRNQFAHDPPDLGFEDVKIRSFVEEIYAYEAPFAGEKVRMAADLPKIDLARMSIRGLFVARTALVFVQLFQELTSAPKALRMGLPANAALTVEDDRRPVIFKSSMMMGVRIALETMIRDAGEEENHL